MTQMIATKRLRYGTRRLLPEEPFTARTTADARFLSAIGRARYVTADAQAGERPPRKLEPLPKKQPAKGERKTKAEREKVVRASRKPQG